MIAIVGYGNQGKAQAQNLRDSGFDVVIGGISDETLEQARKDGFKTYSIKEACSIADTIFLLIPDEVMPGVYEKDIAPVVKGKTLDFASGYNITYSFIKPPEDCDVIMIAPRMIGAGVRESFLKKEKFPAFVGVRQDYSGKAKENAMKLCEGIGAKPIEATFEDETYLDLMSEQATWPLITAVIEEVFKFEVEHSHPDIAVLSELYMSGEPAEVFEKMAEMGLYKQLSLHSHTSQYGQLTRARRIDRTAIRGVIEKAYEEIKSGVFAREFELEKMTGMKVFDTLKKEVFNSEITKAEERARK